MGINLLWFGFGVFFVIMGILQCRDEYDKYLIEKEEYEDSLKLTDEPKLFSWGEQTWFQNSIKGFNGGLFYTISGVILILITLSQFLDSVYPNSGDMLINGIAIFIGCTGLYYGNKSFRKRIVQWERNPEEFFVRPHFFHFLGSSYALPINIGLVISILCLILGCKGLYTVIMHFFTL